MLPAGFPSADLIGDAGLHGVILDELKERRLPDVCPLCAVRENLGAAIAALRRELAV